MHYARLWNIEKVRLNKQPKSIGYYLLPKRRCYGNLEINSLHTALRVLLPLQILSLPAILSLSSIVDRRLTEWKLLVGGRPWRGPRTIRRTSKRRTALRTASRRFRRWLKAIVDRLKALLKPTGISYSTSTRSTKVDKKTKATMTRCETPRLTSTRVNGLVTVGRTVVAGGMWRHHDWLYDVKTTSLQCWAHIFQNTYDILIIKLIIN